MPVGLIFLKIPNPTLLKNVSLLSLSQSSISENKMDVDVIQAITHSLSYTYQRCPRAVKVPAPVYYAHLIAERGRVHLRGQIQLVPFFFLLSKLFARLITKETG